MLKHHPLLHTQLRAAMDSDWCPVCRVELTELSFPQKAFISGVLCVVGIGKGSSKVLKLFRYAQQLV